MSHEEIISKYTVEDGIITTLGKFERESYYIPYYWTQVLDGLHDEFEEDRLLIAVFNLYEDDFEIFPELIGHKQLHVWEASDGFVYSDLR